MGYNIPNDHNNSGIAPFDGYVVTRRSNGNDHLFVGINSLVGIIHQANINAGWWTDLDTGEDLRHSTDGRKRNIPEMLCLVHSEISEGLEGYRKNLMDDKLPHRPMLEVELADALIRIFDLAGGMGYDLGGAIREKMDYNASREDHKIESRRKEGGKRI